MTVEDDHGHSQPRPGEIDPQERANLRLQPYAQAHSVLCSSRPTKGRERPWWLTASSRAPSAGDLTSQPNSVKTLLRRRRCNPLRKPSRLNMSPSGSAASAAAAATSHSFNKILNYTRSSSKPRSAADVEESIKKLRRLILVDGIPSSVVCLF